MAKRLLPAIQGALGRARWGILTIGVTHAVAVVVGMAMAHSGNALALERRDSIVASARNGATLVADRQGEHLRAALIDFTENLVRGGMTSTITGLAVIGPYPIAAYRGWVGGVVSVNDRHESRLADSGSAVYYLVTLILQLIPYTLAGGAGVSLGISAWRTRADATVPKWLTFPRAAVLDVAWIYVLVVPLFLIAALWEFLA
ncbi:MAG: hypothetical protein HYX94_09770 [Chloroflexi bacterium]|nr:hypothetical protein [Chloroflexota bacterium]